MQNEELEKEIKMKDTEFSRNMGVPDILLKNIGKFLDWHGDFTATINNRVFNMRLTPTTLDVNHVDPKAPTAHLWGSEWIDTPMGKLFHANYSTSQLSGHFQIFRNSSGSPFPGFEKVLHSHMLVYTDGSNEKQYVPVQIKFA